jgi:hypothetical protein
MISVDVYEEEDFCPHLGKFELDYASSDEQIVQMVECAEREVRERSEGSDEEKRIREKLLARIELQKVWLGVLIQLNGVGDVLSSLKKLEEKVSKIESLVKSDLFSENDGFAIDWNSPDTFPRGFDIALTKVQNPSAPPRKPELVAYSKVLTFFKDTCKCTKILIDFLKYPTSKTSSDYDSAILFAWNLSELMNPNAFVRSLVLLSFGTESDFLHGGPLRKAIKKSLCSYSSSANAAVSSFAVLGADSEELKVFEMFVDRIAIASAQFFRLLSQNRSKQHIKIQKSIIDWALLENDAAICDKFANKVWNEIGIPPAKLQKMYQNPFFSWVSDITVKLIFKQIMIGFELKLYSKYEYPGMYWAAEYYLDFRLKAKYYSANVAFDFFVNSSGSKATKKKGKAEKSTRFKHTIDFKDPVPPPIDFYYTEALKSMCRAMHLSLKFLLLKNLFKKSDQSFEFGSEENRWLQRISWAQILPFPPIPSFEKFKSSFCDASDSKSDDTESSLKSTLEEATSSFKYAKTIFDSILTDSSLRKPNEYSYQVDALSSQLFKTLSKICVTNTVFLLSLDRTIEKLKSANQSPTTLSLSFELHHWFPTMSIHTK